MNATELILHNGKFTTLDPKRPEVQAVMAVGGRFTVVGDDAEVLKLRSPKTPVIDLGGRRAIPGLNDSHLHLIRGGLNYNMELRWDGVPSLADALRMLKNKPAARHRRNGCVVGSWNEFQFRERRMPTLDEILPPRRTRQYSCSTCTTGDLNRAALRAVGYTKDTRSGRW